MFDFVFGCECEFAVHWPDPERVEYLHDLKARWRDQELQVNGGRLYIDDPHPEYASPECRNVRRMIAHDKAGELHMTARFADEDEPRLIKNNAGPRPKSEAWSWQFNVSWPGMKMPSTELKRVEGALSGFLLTQPVIAGAGRVDLPGDAGPYRFVLAQRPRLVDASNGSHALGRLGMFTERYDKGAHLEITCLDSTMAETATLLKTGSILLVIEMARRGVDMSQFRVGMSGDSIAVSHGWKVVTTDLSFEETIYLDSGQRMRPIDVQEAYLTLAEAVFAADRLTDPLVNRTLDLWRLTVDSLKVPGTFLEKTRPLIHINDYAAKYHLIHAACEKRKKGTMAWHSELPAAIDLQYHDIDRAHSLYYRAERKGLFERVCDDAEIQRATYCAETNTRAQLRVRAIALAHSQSSRAPEVKWSSVQIPVGSQGWETLSFPDVLSTECPRLDELEALVRAGGKITSQEQGTQRDAALS